MRLIRLVRMAAALFALTIVAACGGGSDGADQGTLRLSLTDAPSCGYDQVNVAIQKIRVHKSGTAGDTDGGWSELNLATPKRVDLLSLSNGVLSSLGQLPLPAGRYTQMRLVLAANDAANPLLNSVVPTGGSETALTVPSGQQSGLKINVDITIAANQIADFVLDFDACKSLVTAGASGKVLLKPVVTVVPNHLSGVSGLVAQSLANGNTLVSVQQGGVVVKATAPDSAGRFLLQPVAPGSYDLVVTAPGRASAVVTGVAVTASTVTLLNEAAAPLLPPAGASGTATGAVATGATPVDARVRALQTLGNGVTIEIIDRAVDSATGAYSYALPVSATMVAAFVAPLGALNFSADATTASKYGLEARSGGLEKTAGPLTLTAGGATTTNFVFP